MLATDVFRRQDEADNGPRTKRVRTSDTDGSAELVNRASQCHARKPVSSTLRVNESALFRPVKAIGVVTDGLPVCVQMLGDATTVVVSIGHGFQIFDGDKLRLAFLGPRLNQKIRAILCVGLTVITALKTDIVVWHRLTEIGRFRGHRSPATSLCAVGATYLVSVAGSEVLVWQLSDLGLEEATTALKDPATRSRSGCVLAPVSRLTIGQDFGFVTAVRHPPTYLHKVILAGSNGGLELWNIRTCERVHSFRSHLVNLGTGIETCSITCLQEAPNALDIVAVGFGSGRICIMNAREDRVLFEVQQAQGRVTSLAFRTGSTELSHLVSGAPTGDLVVWDLEKRRAHHVLEAAHRGPISSLHYIPDQPILLTSGRDNALKMWIFDTADGLPRYLKGRIGCPGPPRRLLFYGPDDTDMLVGGGFEGSGFLSKVSFIQEHQNLEYSQQAWKKMTTFMKSSLEHLPAVVAIARCEVRHFDWPAVVTAHEGLESAMVWSASHKALSNLVLQPPPEANGSSPVSAVAISSCGNYCVLGLENGSLHRFNLQSGLHRGPIPKLPDKVQDAESIGEGQDKSIKDKVRRAKMDRPALAHHGRVCGVDITVSGQVVSTASHPKDCSLRIWKLGTHEALGTIPLAKGPGSQSSLVMRTLGVLYAVALDDGCIRIADLTGMAVVRSFACGVPATDLAFTSDGRWLAAALCDGGMRIFDLPAARCIDSFVFTQPVLGLCFSPSTAFLLTTHAKGNAIQVWANKYLFDPSLSAPLLRPEPSAPVHVDQPGVQDGDEVDDKQECEEDVSNLQQVAIAPVSTVPLEPLLLTLTDVPPAKVLATLHLDMVKERNKALEPPKPLPNAPFFLPTFHEGVVPRFIAPLGEEDGNTLAEPTSRPSLLATLLEAERDQGHSRVGSTAGSLPFQTLLRKGNFDKALEFLKAQTPSGVHLAIEELGPLAGGDERDFRAGLDFFQYHLGKSHYADEVQAFLSLFLQAHGEELAISSELRKRCASLGQEQEKTWTSLSTKCQKARCFLGMLTQTQSQW